MWEEETVETDQSAGGGGVQCGESEGNVGVPPQHVQCKQDAERKLGGQWGSRRETFTVIY